MASIIKRLKLWTVIKKTYKEWMDRDPFRESAIIAYYSIFSLPGLFVVIVTLAGFFFGRDAVNQHIINQITSSMGQDTAQQIQNIISQQERQTETRSIWGAVIGIATLLLGATGVFAQFQKSLNNIWEVKADTSKSGIWQVVKVRLFSFGLIVSIAFLLMISLMISTMLTAFGNWLSGQFSESLLIILKVVNFVISLAILTLLFALMLKVFPDAKIKWKDVWIGSFVTAILFIIGRFALSMYFAKANPATAYGAAGSIIIILLWVSYSSMIVFFGAEFTRQYANIH
ncbi:MAG TPA: YihY/virulence factor BrkB family protein, partial [Bacteroidales bacterium]|nr:YihY/virulence factor BrkB family protein [Bacteroidales bacterium]